MQRKRTSLTTSVSAAPMKRQKPNRRTAPRRPLGRTSLTEVKSFDATVTSNALSLVAAVTANEPSVAFPGICELNCIRQDGTVAGRIGNKVVIKSLHFKVNVANANVANLACARMMLVYDRSPNGTFPAIGDLLLDQPGNITTFFSGLNIANKSRFQIIRDQFFNLDAAQADIHTINWYCKGRWEVEFGGNAGTIADFRTGAIYLVGFYVNAAVSINTAECRCRFFD